MRLLLDSHVALWWLGDDARLVSRARDTVFAADEVFVSVVTPWELGIKRASRKITFPDDLVLQLEAAGFEMLPVRVDHAVAAPELPPHHGDPFDRMLIAQARSERLVIVTADKQFESYEVELFAAT